LTLADPAFLGQGFEPNQNEHRFKRFVLKPPDSYWNGLSVQGKSQRDFAKVFPSNNLGNTAGLGLIPTVNQVTVLGQRT